VTPARDDSIDDAPTVSGLDDVVVVRGARHDPAAQHRDDPEPELDAVALESTSTFVIRCVFGSASKLSMNSVIAEAPHTGDRRGRSGRKLHRP
jgi:hypothetical protein